MSSSSGSHRDELPFPAPHHTVLTSTSGWSALGEILLGMSFNSRFSLLIRCFSVLITWKRAASFNSWEQQQKGSCWWWRCTWLISRLLSSGCSVWVQAWPVGLRTSLAWAVGGSWAWHTSDSSSTAQPCRSSRQPPCCFGHAVLAIWVVLLPVDRAAAALGFTAQCWVLQGKLTVPGVDLFQFLHYTQLKITRCLLGSKRLLQ